LLSGLAELVERLHVAYRLKKGKSASKELSRVVAREFEKAVTDLDHADSSPAEAVYEARKHVKKIRAVLRMLQKDLGKDYVVQNRRLRTVAHQLSSLRDADAAADTMESVRRRYPQLVTPSILASVQKGLRSRKRVTTARVDPEHLVPRVERSLRRSAERTPQRVRRVVRRTAMSAGILRGYERARDALAEVHTTPDDGMFHRWRRRVKDHWYHIRLLEGLNGRAHARARTLKRLETWLGDDHNLVLLRGTILDNPTRFGDEKTTALVLGCVTKHQTSLRRRALKLGDRAFAQKPRAFRRLVARWLR
jgi:CHAD domain-containing protein